MVEFSDEVGHLCVKIAREVIEIEINGGFRVEKPQKMPAIFEKKLGVFVTLNMYPSGELRGCIGYPEPIYPLLKAIKDSAKNAAFGDPRFPALRRDELDKITVEVSLLTKPELIVVKNPREYPKHIEIGRDGLIVERGYMRGLLLPQVPVEYNWNVEEFLQHTCMKAGLTPDMWLDERTKIYNFSAEIFAETKPYGDIRRKKLR